MKNDYFILATLLIIFSFIIGMLIGIEMEESDVSVTKVSNGYLLRDNYGDDIHIMTLNDTTYIISHPKLN